MTNKRATEEALSELHAELAGVLKKAVQYRDPDTQMPQAALLNVARQFLKDNKIESQAPAGSPLRDLADLPEFDDFPEAPGAMQ
jgi:hypothetical protein